MPALERSSHRAGSLQMTLLVTYEDYGINLLHFLLEGVTSGSFFTLQGLLHGISGLHRASLLLPACVNKRCRDASRQLAF